MHRRFDRFGRPEGIPAEIGEFPATRTTDEDAATEDMFEGGDAPGDGGVVES